MSVKRAVLAAVLVSGVIAAEWAAVAGQRARAAAGSPSDAVVGIDGLGEFRAAHAGGRDDFRAWMTPQVDAAGRSVGMVRATRSGGEVFVTVQRAGRWEFRVRGPWAGDGRYPGTLTDAATGSVSAVAATVVLPPVGPE